MLILVGTSGVLASYEIQGWPAALSVALHGFE